MRSPCVAAPLVEGQLHENKTAIGCLRRKANLGERVDVGFRGQSPVVPHHNPVACRRFRPDNCGPDLLPVQLWSGHRLRPPFPLTDRLSGASS